MKVKELIEELKKFNPELPVVCSGYEGGADDINKLKLIDILLNYYDVWYYGAHKVVKKGEKFYDNEKPIKVLYLY